MPSGVEVYVAFTGRNLGCNMARSMSGRAGPKLPKPPPCGMQLPLSILNEP